MLGKTGKRLTMDDMKERLAFFLMNYEDPEMIISEDECYARLGKLKYRIALQQIANQKLNRIEIHIEDIEDMLRKEEDRAILDLAKNNSRRCVEMFHEIIEKSVPARNIELNPE